ncbi:hypothetical protein CDAR_229631 [Caerostris darwini]|uniref:Uncharacterized protein n=1 Tax=Caerostris darwini TaxID=1538125 RepID=A0AAV4PZC2_9ARAC|nr:hypothetical protein CDAR_229631 [Caerostris darwini]
MGFSYSCKFFPDFPRSILVANERSASGLAISRSDRGSTRFSRAQVGPGMCGGGEGVPKILTYLGFSGIPGFAVAIAMFCSAQITRIGSKKREQSARGWGRLIYLR